MSSRRVHGTTIIEQTPHFCGKTHSKVEPVKKIPVNQIQVTASNNRPGEFRVKFICCGFLLEKFNRIVSNISQNNNKFFTRTRYHLFDVEGKLDKQLISLPVKENFLVFP